MSDIERNIDFGLNKVDATRKVELPLRDALYVFKVLGEYMSFFHQPANYPTIESVEKFLGTIDEGAFHVLHEAYYKRMSAIWPPDIEDMFNNGDLDRNPFLDPQNQAAATKHWKFRIQGRHRECSHKPKLHQSELSNSGLHLSSA